MRIVQVVPDLRIGGAELFATWLAQAQMDAGHDAHVLCIRGGGPLCSRLSPTLAARVWTAGKQHRLDVSVLPRLVRTLRALRPDVVHTHLFTALAWAGVAARAAGVPVVVHTEHAMHDETHPDARLARPALGAMLDAVVGCNEAVAHDVRRRGWAGRTPVHAIDNGLPLTDRPRARLGHRPLRLVSVGRLVPVKGHADLLDAIALLVAEGIPVHLTLLGDGPCRVDLEARTRESGLTDHVTFAGTVDDVCTRLTAFDLFVLPSHSEAMPLALLEAAAAGLPLLVTDAGGAPTLVRQGAGGQVVAPHDPAALAHAIASHAALPVAQQRRLGAASKQTVVRQHDISGCAARYETLYRTLLG